MTTKRMKNINENPKIKNIFLRHSEMCPVFYTVNLGLNEKPNLWNVIDKSNQ